MTFKPGDVGHLVEHDRIADELAGRLSDTALSATIGTSAGVSIESFGAVGDDPTADNAAAITAALASGKPLIVPAKSYRVATLISTSFSGVRMSGLPGARIYSDNLDEFIRLGTTDDAVVTGIMFESTFSGASTTGTMILSYGVVRNFLFDSCTFRAAAGATNGVKLVADNAAEEYAIENVYARNCVFVECGRMGLEIQDHTVSPSYTKVRAVGVSDSVFRDCGKISYGIDLSFSGPIVSASAVRNKFYGSLSISAEFAGAHIAPVAADNEFYDLADAAYTLSFTNTQNTSDVPNAVIERNRTPLRTGAGARFWNLTDARMSNNVLKVKGYVYFRDSRRTKSKGDVYDSSGQHALYVENSSNKDCSYNTWEDAELSTTASTNPFAVTRFSGARTFRNTVRDSRYSRALGNRSDQLSGAAINQMVRCAYNETPWLPLRTIALSDADRTLTLDEVDCGALVFTGTLTAQQAVIFPASSRSWKIRNATTQQLSIYSPGGNNLLLPAGSSFLLALDNITSTYA